MDLHSCVYKKFREIGCCISIHKPVIEMKLLENGVRHELIYNYIKRGFFVNVRGMIMEGKHVQGKIKAQSACRLLMQTLFFVSSSRFLQRMTHEEEPKLQGFFSHR